MITKISNESHWVSWLLKHLVSILIWQKNYFLSEEQYLNGAYFFLKEVIIWLLEAICFSMSMEFITKCMYTSKIGKVLLSLQVYIYCLAMRPKQRPGEREASFVRLRFWEIHCKVFFPKKLTILAVPKQVDKGFRSIITKRTRVYLFYANFVENVIGSYSSVEKLKLESS